MTERHIGGRYTLEHKLAGGGMGSVWVALDRQLERRVALKLMAVDRLGSPEARRLFEQEARAVARLHHPHVVQVYDYGVEGDEPYLVMELLQGEDLEARLTRQGRLPPLALASLLQQVARALTAAHEAGIIHRDLKPANLFLARVEAGEVVKVLDFGLARLAAAGPGEALPHDELMGTPRYMSPEQFQGDPGVDHRSDLWSLAVVAYRALTGEFPFAATLGDLVSEAVPPQPQPASRALPELGAEVDAFFSRALAVDPSKRFQSARELAQAFSLLVEAARPSRPSKILVVDDEPDMALLMKQRFRKQIRSGTYEFIFASDGEDALEKLRQHPDVDVVLSDINMPRMDGLTFLSRVGEVNPLLKVVILSAYGDLGNVRTAMNRGAFDFLVKPLDFQDLEATIVKTLRHVVEIRQMLRSVEENSLLRMFVQRGIAERMLPLVREPDLLGGERVEATVAFLDVKDFSAATRHQPPEAVIRQLNTHFELIVPELTARGGEVDKFVGDAVMVAFRGPEHLERALEACLSVRQQLHTMSLRYGEHSPYAHSVGVGLDSGEVVCGSIGSRALGRLEYTVLGEVVNTAARLASASAREQILISQAVYERALVQERFECASLGARSLPGTPHPVLVYDVLRRRERLLGTANPDSTTMKLQASGVRVAPARTPPEGE